jgi:hypothetical protein
MLACKLLLVQQTLTVHAFIPSPTIQFVSLSTDEGLSIEGCKISVTGFEDCLTGDHEGWTQKCFKQLYKQWQKCIKVYNILKANASLRSLLCGSSCPVPGLSVTTKYNTVTENVILASSLIFLQYYL